MASYLTVFVRRILPYRPVQFPTKSVSYTFNPTRLHRRTMASLSSYLANLPQLPQLPGTEPDKCVLDSFRIAIAKIVSEALPPLTVEQVYSGVDYGKKGVDFTIAIPRFRLPGKVDEHAQKVLSQVSTFRYCSHHNP